MVPSTHILLKDGSQLEFDAIYTIYQRIGSVSKKKTSPLSRATLVALIDTSLSLVGVGCSFSPYISFHCFRSRFS